MRLVIQLLLLALAFAAAAPAQESLDNDAVIKLVKSGIGDDLVVSMINTQPGTYKTGADDVIALKDAGVSDKVLAAMIARGKGGAPSAAPGFLPEIGVYYRKDAGWKELMPEVVNWKTVGKLKKFGTAGLAKSDVNGDVTGAHSPTSVTMPLDILIYAADGAKITDYQFLHLRENGDTREFRTAAGGVRIVSGGARSDVIPFESDRIAPRTWKVTLPNLGAGDYGFLAPGAATSANAPSIGKIYSFRIIE
jgi:hypothetical protein